MLKFMLRLSFCGYKNRDIKGANLLVNSSGVVKLADFGLAKHVSFLELVKQIHYFNF